MFGNKTTQTQPTSAPAHGIGAQVLHGINRAALQTLAATAFVFAGSLAVVDSASAEPVRITNLGSYSSLNLRTAPTTQSSVITQMPAGATNLDWTGNQVTNGSTLWYEVVYQGRVGWAAARYLTTTSSGYVTSTPAVQYPDQGDYVPDYDYNYVVTTPTVPTTTYSTPGQITGEQVGAALFGLVVGGILASVLDDDGGSSSGSIQLTPPQPIAPTPAPQPPRRTQIACDGDGVSFTYQRNNGAVKFTRRGGRVMNGSATRRLDTGERSFAIPFEAGNGTGTLVVENIRAGGQNAHLIWNGPRTNRLFNVNCRRNRI